MGFARGFVFPRARSVTARDQARVYCRFARATLCSDAAHSTDINSGRAEMKVTSNTIALAAAAMFTAGIAAAVVAPASAQSTVKCIGANSCKGTSACKTAASACKGMNACKGQGWTEQKDTDACKKAGGIGIKFQS